MSEHLSESLDEQLLAELEGIFEDVDWNLVEDGVVGVLPWNGSRDELLVDLEWYGFRAEPHGDGAVKATGWLE